MPILKKRNCITEYYIPKSPELEHSEASVIVLNSTSMWGFGWWG